MVSRIGGRRVDLLGVIEVLHEHLPPGLCAGVFDEVRDTERRRLWTLEKLAGFWTQVVLQAPRSLTLGAAFANASAASCSPRGISSSATSHGSGSSFAASALSATSSFALTAARAASAACSGVMGGTGLAAGAGAAGGFAGCASSARALVARMVSIASIDTRRIMTATPTAPTPPSSRGAPRAGPAS